MHDIIQRENFAIGDRELIDSLESKDSVKILLISDSHGSKIILREILQSFGSSADVLCFCGDGISDLVECLEQAYYDPDFAARVPNAVFFVQGNGDNSTATLLTENRYYITVPSSQFFKAAGKNIFLSHGHKFDVYYGTKTLYKRAVEINADVVFYGHTHIANAQIKTRTENGAKRKICIFNPGSCSIPRGGLPHTFAIVTLAKNKPVAEYKYFEITHDENDDFTFNPYTPPTNEINLLW